MHGFEKNKDSSMLAFVVSCNLMGAIDFKEYKEYFYSLINDYSVDDLPPFIWDLLDLKEEDRFLIYNILGFVPDSKLTLSEKNAIYGITVVRFGSFFDMPISEIEALRALKENPHILNKFKSIFPFIELHIDCE